MRILHLTLNFVSFIALLIGLVIVAGLPRARGRGLLLGCLALLLLANVLVITFSLITASINPALWALSHVSETTALLLLLVFISTLKSVSQISGATAGGAMARESMSIGRALFSFDGRLCRSDYWLKGFLLMLPVGIFNNVLAYGVDEDWARALAFVIALLSLWPGLALIVKRLHDRDKSGWFALIMLIPLVGPLILLVGVWFMKGTDGPNRFGPDPLQPTPEPAPAAAAT